MVKFDAELCERLEREWKAIAVEREWQPSDSEQIGDALADQLAAARAEIADTKECRDDCERENVRLAAELTDVYKERNEARAEVDRLTRVVASQCRLLNENANVYNAMRRAHEAEVDTLAATRREFDAYRAARGKEGA